MTGDCTRANDIDNLDYHIRDLEFQFEKLELKLYKRMDELEDTIKNLLERIIILERDIGTVSNCKKGE